jgi:hypothetical protein
MTNATPDQLRAMAAWQYRWAELAGSDEERQRRRQFADYLHRLAKKQEARPERSGGPENVEAGAAVART